MKTYQKVEVFGVLKSEPNKGYWLRYNADGSLDLCSTDKSHPDFKKKVEADRKAKALESKRRREERVKARKIEKAKATLRELGEKV